MTWFQKMEGVHWFHPDQTENIAEVLRVECANRGWGPRSTDPKPWRVNRKTHGAAQRSTSMDGWRISMTKPPRTWNLMWSKQLLLNHCHNPTTVDRATQLHPRVNPKSWRRELNERRNSSTCGAKGPFQPSEEEIAADNERLAVRDSVLDEAGFNRIRTATETVNGVIEALEGKADGFPRLCELVDGLEPNEELPKAIDGVFDAKGEVREQRLAQTDSNPGREGSLAPKLNRQFLKELKKNQERMAGRHQRRVHQPAPRPRGRQHPQAQNRQGPPWGSRRTPPSPSSNPHRRCP